MDVSCACVPCAYSHERACASTSRVRGRRVCAFTSVHCIDISCACAAVVCARSRACVALMSRVRAR